MGRKCSHCGSIGHNSRTCTSDYIKTTNFVAGGGVKLFGVRLDMPHLSSSSFSLKKSFSKDILYSSPSSSSSLCSSRDENSDKTNIDSLSECLIGRAQERKKGVPWTEEEHRSFLIGLEKLEKGDWRGIARNYVTTRTSTQVASHAQKYFLRLASHNKKKRPLGLSHGWEQQQHDRRHVNTCNSLSSDEDAIPSLPGHNSFQQNNKLDDQEKESSQLGICSTYAQIWVDGSKEDRKINLPNSAKPNLDLTLAAPPSYLNENQSSPEYPFLNRRIRVT